MRIQINNMLYIFKGCQIPEIPQNLGKEHNIMVNQKGYMSLNWIEIHSQLKSLL